MSIRLASSCSHCEAFSAGKVCKVHDLKVSEDYVCDRFSLIPKLDSARHCGNCARHQTDACAHPSKATEGMLCASWAPQA